MSAADKPGGWVPDLEARGGVVGRHVAPLGLLSPGDEWEWYDGETGISDLFDDPEWMDAQRRCPVIVTRWADGTVPAAPEVTDPPSDGDPQRFTADFAGNGVVRFYDGGRLMGSLVNYAAAEAFAAQINAAARPAPSTPAADDHDGHTINLGAPSTVTAATEPTERGDLAKHVGAKIRAAREQAHMTQAQVAERLDCTPTAVSYWESGARHLPPEMVSHMAAALGVTAPDLLPTAWFAPSPSPVPQANPRPSTPADTVPVPRAELVAAAFIVQEAIYCEGLQNWWGTDSRNMADLNAALDFLRAAAEVTR